MASRTQLLEMLSGRYGLPNEVATVVAQYIFDKPRPKALAPSTETLVDYLMDEGKDGGAVKLSDYNFDEGNPRDHIVKEILTTEVAYVKNLRTLNETYICPLGERIAEGSEAGEAIISKEECDTLFRDVKPVFDLHQSLVQDLSAHLLAWPEWTFIGRLFMEYAPFFKMYSKYSQNHERVNNFITTLQEKNKKFARFCSDVRNNNEIRTIESYLIMPIQRLPRYLLLFQQLLKHCPTDSEDYSNLKAAFQMINTSAQHVNKMVQDVQQLQHVIDIQNMFVDHPRLVAPHRNFVHEGTLTIRTKKSDVTFQAFLFNDLFVLASQVIVKYKVYLQVPLDTAFFVDGVMKAAPQTPRSRVRQLKTDLDEYKTTRSRSLSPDRTSSLKSRENSHRKRRASIKHFRKWSTAQAVKRYTFVVWNSIESFTACTESRDDKETWISLLNVTAEKAAKNSCSSPRRIRSRLSVRVAALHEHCSVCEQWANVNRCRRCLNMVCYRCSDTEKKFSRGPVATARICKNCTGNPKTPKSGRSKKKQLSFFPRTPSLPKIARKLSGRSRSRTLSPRSQR